MGQFLRKAANLCGIDYRRLSSGNRSDVSQFSERAIVDKYLDEIGTARQVCVDIGAVDGIMLSNTFHLVQRGWSGAAVEFSPIAFRELAWNYQPFKSVNLLRLKATPSNIGPALHGCGIPNDFDFLSLDIDSYDYFVLDAILNQFRPRLVCTEINARIPPPVRFAVKYDENLSVDADFFGSSLSQIAILAEKHEYRVVGLNYVNAFLVPKELWLREVSSIARIYKDGYSARSDKYVHLPQDRAWAHLLTCTPNEVIQELDRQFARYSGKYDIGLS